MMLTVMIFSVVAIVCTVYGLQIITWWTGEDGVVPSLSLLLACLFFLALSELQSVFGQFLMGVNRLTLQAYYTTALSVFSVFCGYLFAEQLGVSGIIWLIASIGMGGQLILKIFDSFVYLK